MADNSKESHEGGVKDTVEAILVAFILAFIFRAFVVEAFVIPTGSMATTLYGAHMRLTCPDCGYTFDVNYSVSPSASEDPDESPPAYVPRTYPYHCPNCGYEFGPEAAQPVRFGDRILVLKYLYIFHQPTRWDVVVFKSPSEPGPDPINPEFSKNYIKRLVGLPNESIVILDGDVYTGPHNATADTPGLWHIQRKPDYAQKALWRPVFDNDYLPNVTGHVPLDRGINDAFRDPWTAQDTGGGWDVGTPTVGKRMFHFSNLTGSGTVFFDGGVDSNTLHRLYNFVPYDEGLQQPQWPVGDLKLSVFYHLAKASADGELNLMLTKDQDCFTARLTPRGVELWRGKLAPTPNFQVIDQHRVAGPVAVDWRSPGVSTQVDFANVDHEVSVRVGGKKVITYDYAPDVAKLFSEADDPSWVPAAPQVRISAAKEDCTLDHILLWRDVYYLNNSPDMAHGVPRAIAHLGPGEYFVLGDNSPNSSDARYWKNDVDLIRGENLLVQSGRVPARFMLGKAFFVYWPAGFRPAGIPLGIVPDFGEMRFIH